MTLSVFCACDDPTHGSVLGVDPTFNVGDFYVIPTTYEHKLLRNRKTSKHPVFIGPVMIHQNQKHGTYYYFASSTEEDATWPKRPFCNQHRR